MAKNDELPIVVVEIDGEKSQTNYKIARKIMNELGSTDQERSTQ
jgi:Cdc6-like AAA superfamily ATPase